MRPPVCKTQMADPITIPKIIAGHNAAIERLKLPLFQARLDPTGKIIAMMIKNGVNAKSKKGAPTLSFLSKNKSANNGQRVPINTTNADTINNRLFKTNALSRLTNEKVLFDLILCDCTAKSIKAPPVAIKRIIKMKIPLVGSFANA